MRIGRNFTTLTEDEQRKVSRIWRLADQFIAADKYIFVTPMWNLGFPAELKMYIDTVCVAGKTFKYTPAGPEGLLKNQGRKCLHIHSSERQGDALGYLSKRRFRLALLHFKRG